MQLLGEEKELKADESAFWNGSYLLEGVVDQSGYSKDVITINARLTPSKGGVPLPFEVSGSRSNLAEVINQLAAKVTGLLQVKSSVPEWNAADEATQYLDEAKWALRWGIYPEAQAAIESAWALGKRDLDCALVRIKTYVSEVPMVAAPNVAYFQDGKRANYVHINETPDPKYCEAALYALKCYYEFSQTSPEGEPKILSRGKGWNDWHNSDWYQLGIDDLVAASRVLQHFNYVPESQKPAAEKLAELRALARSVAGLISKSPSVHDSYFVGDRIATHDELGHTIEESPNIFRCKVNWGCFWQERPEEEIALYRDLMSSPVFCYIHGDFWRREWIRPRLVAWNQEDQARLPAIWENFVQELDNSTNALLRLEARALTLADARGAKQVAAAFTNLFDTLFDNRDLLVTNNVELLYLNWGADNLVNAISTDNDDGAALGEAPPSSRTPKINFHTVPMAAPTGTETANVRESLQRRFYDEYRPKLEAMDREYWDKTIPAGKTASVFEQQKQYLVNFTPYDFRTFDDVFSERDYTKTQAAELQPLIAAYKSNMVAQASAHATNAATRGLSQARFKAQADAKWIEVFLEKRVDEILNPPAPNPRPALQAQAPVPKPAPTARPVVMAPVSTNAPETVTNVIPVRKFLALPLDGLQGDQISGVAITAHHWLEGKLLLDFKYGAFIYSFDAKGNWRQTRNVTFPAIAILDLASEHWDVIGCPEVEIGLGNTFYHRSALWHGELVNCDGGQLKKYDFQNRQWQVLPVSDGNNYELFAVQEHLYAASRDMIFEILEGGKSTRILASSRRNPPASALDRENLGTPTLFEGPNHSLRVCTAGKIFTWTGNDWHGDSPAPAASFPPEVIPDGLLFRSADFSWPDRIASLSYLATETNAPELCLWQKISSPNNMPDYRSGAKAAPPPEPSWKMPPDLVLAHLPVAASQSGLYLLMNHSEIQEIANDQHVAVEEKVVAKDGYNAALLCFSRGLPLPQKLFLKFDAPDGCPPAAGIDPNSSGGFPVLPPAWMLATTNILFLGLENPINSMPAFNQAGRIGIGYKAGIWLLPVSQIEPEIAAQKQILLGRLAKEKADAAAAAEQHRKDLEQRHKDLLAKYDRNRNGILDPDEKEEALDDPAFIESELDTIDANHNGRLDAEELVWFDANQNKILEPKEQAGIDIAQHLLATRLLKQFDVNGDGFLDRAEFDSLWPPNEGTRQPAPARALLPDDNRDGHVDLAELEMFLKQQTRRGLRSRGMAGAAIFNQIKDGANQPVGSQQLFKAAVELYWQHPGGITNGPPFNRGIPPGRGGVTNGIPGGKAP